MQKDHQGYQEFKQRKEAAILVGIGRKKMDGGSQKTPEDSDSEEKK